VLVKVGLPRSMPYFFASLKVAITLASVGTVLAEMTAGDRGLATSCRVPDHNSVLRWRLPGWW
jgi:ABC-type nitrate/sulfonate/bicarbonate transport system permease component